MYFFEDIKKDKELKRELDEWLNTPYRHCCRVKKLGCDCIGLVVGVLEAIKAIPSIKIEPYPRDWHLHRDEERLYNGVIEQFNVEELYFDDMMNGDIILFQYGRAASHAGIYYDGYIYEALNNMRVEKRNWLDKEKQQRKKFHFRLLI